MQSTGLISFAAVMWAAGRWPVFEAGMLPYALALGLTGVIAVAALYRGLALGPVAVVAPVVASYVVITVILVVVFLGVVLTSGKSTTIRMLIGLLRPSAGTIEVDGVDVIRTPRKVRDHIGY